MCVASSLLIIVRPIIYRMKVLNSHFCDISFLIDRTFVMWQSVRKVLWSCDEIQSQYAHHLWPSNVNILVYRMTSVPNVVTMWSPHSFANSPKILSINDFFMSFSLAIFCISLYRLSSEVRFQLSVISFMLPLTTRQTSKAIELCSRKVT